jgi:hypothetical protein
MTSDQVRLNDLYSGCSIAIFVMCLAWAFFYAPLVTAYNAVFPSDGDHVGEAQDIPFRDVRVID